MISALVCGYHLQCYMHWYICSPHATYVYSARMHNVYSFLCASSDQEYVEGYRVRIVSTPTIGSCNETQKDIAFDSKVCVHIRSLVSWAVGGYLYCISHEL